MTAKDAPEQKTSPVPSRDGAGGKRQTVERGLRELVAALSAGSRLPPLTELRRTFGVGAGTVQTALEVLGHEGLIVTRHGAGSFVAPSSSGDDLVSPPAASDRAVPASSVLIALVLQRDGFVNACLDHLAEQAGRSGRAVEVHFDTDQRTEDEVLQMAERGPVGFVVIGRRAEWAAELLYARGYPVVVLGEPPSNVDPKVPTIFSDAEAGGYMAARHLLSLGHQRIAFLHQIPAHELTLRRRGQGHLRALREAGLDDGHPVVLNGEGDLSAWCADTDAVRRTFNAADAPTAVAAWSDGPALMLISALHRAGLHVPEDVSVIGYDNSAFASQSLPPLDSVDQHIDVLIQHALMLLLHASTRLVLPTAVVRPALVLRASTAPWKK